MKEQFYDALLHPTSHSSDNYKNLILVCGIYRQRTLTMTLQAYSAIGEELKMLNYRYRLQIFSGFQKLPNY